jgi:hypothetical protein
VREFELEFGFGGFVFIFRFEGHFQKSLGHPSFDKMHFLHQVVAAFHTINKTSHFCDVCPLAKQKRLPFPNVGHKSTHVFYLTSR